MPAVLRQPTGLHSALNPDGLNPADLAAGTRVVDVRSRSLVAYTAAYTVTPRAVTALCKGCRCGARGTTTWACTCAHQCSRRAAATAARKRFERRTYTHVVPITRVSKGAALAVAGCRAAAAPWHLPAADSFA
jgi:hypothetical protein